MIERVYYTILYDYYSSLLTEKQRLSFEEYYFNNLTLQEISENNGVSRNAIHKQIKEVEKNLLNFEEKLKLYKKSELIKKKINNLDERLRKDIEELI